MRHVVRLSLVAATAAACIDLSLPTPPGPPGPGSLSGRATMMPPGRATPVPVPNARVELLGTGLSATTDSSGLFRIAGVVTEARRVLFRVDLDGDGRPDRQKLLTLDAARVGPGITSVLGDVLLVENATVFGQVLREDVMTTSGHAGSLIFVPEGPYTATTSDDGRFAFTELPEGTLSVAFFRQGYRTQAFDAVSLSSGQELTLKTVTLRLDSSVPQPVSIAGKVRLPEGGPASDATVTLSSASERREVLTGPEGDYSASGLSPGVFQLVASKSGYGSARLTNIAATSGRIELYDVSLNVLPSGAGGGGGFNTDVGGGAPTGGGSSSTGGGSSSVGGGTTSTGGGTSAVGGGSSSTGGGSSSTGGGSSSVGGGSSSTGGGSSSTGGGTSSTGGGTSSTGGGTGSTGGGTGSTGGGTSSTGGGTTSTGGGSTTTVPPRPTNVTATAGDRQVTLTFAPAPGATSHRVYWSNQPTVTRATGTLLGSVTSPTLHQGLTNGSTYFYVVTAVNSVGESLESAVVSAIPSSSAATMNARVLVRRPDVTEPNVRVGARVTARFDRDLNGSTATAMNARLTFVDGGVVPSSVSAAGPTLSITPSSPLAFETEYRVTLGVGLQDSAGRPLSSPDSWTFTTGSPPPALSAQPGDRHVTLTWNEVPGALSAVVRRTVGTTNTTIATVTGTTFTDTNASNGTLTTYRVSVVTPFGESAPSADVSVTPQPSRPEPPSSLNILTGRSTALVWWPASSGATGYTIYRAFSASGPYSRIATAYQSTSFLDTNLPPDTVVSYKVQTEALNGVGAWSTEIAARTEAPLLPAPSNAVATAGHSWVRLTWDAVPQASHYVIWRAVWPSGAPAVLAMVTHGTRFDDLTSAVGTSYRYFIGAAGQRVVGDLSEVSASPIPGLTPAPPRLYEPDVEVERATIGSSVNPLGAVLEVFRSTSADGGYLPVANPDLTAMGGTRYFYTARFRAGTELSELSEPVDVTPVPAVMPGVPDNVTIFPASGAADVSFQAVPNATGYEVGLATAPGGTRTVRCSTFESTATRCVTSLTDNQTVYLSVRALNGQTRGAWSAEQMVRPTNIGVTAGLASSGVSIREGDAFITVSWSTVPSAVEYRVFRRTRRVPWALLATTPSVWFNDATVSNDVDYQYAVLAQNLAPPNTRYAPTQLSAWARPSPLHPPRVTGLTVTPTNGGAIATWDPIPGITSYYVQAGFNSGSAASNSQTYCGTSDAFDSSCQMSLSNGTSYFVSIHAVGPGVNGSSAWADEIPLTPNPQAPAAPAGVTTDPGNDEIVTRGTRVANTTYRFIKRVDDRPEQLLGIRPSSFLVDSNPNGMPVSYEVQALTAQGESPRASTAVVQASARAPKTPQITEALGGQGRYSVLWAPVPGATSYSIYSANTPDGPFTYEGATFEETRTLTSPTATNGQPLYVVVEALSGSGTSTVSQPRLAAPGTSALATPTLFAINGNQAVELWWSTVPSAVGYQVMRRNRTSPWRPLISLTTRRHTDLNVENGETWIYAVRAMGATDPGSFSNESAAQDVRSNLVETPLAFTARPANGGPFMQWARVPGATSYSAFADTDADGPFGTNLCNTNSEWETQCRGTTTGARYVFVRAYGPLGNGVATEPIAVTPNANLPNQTNVSVTATGSGTANVTWQAVSAATTYRVFRRASNGAPAQVNQTTSLAFSDSGLTAGQQYVYYVEVENGVGRGAWSPPALLTAN